ncbi:Chaperone protein [Wickerhamomyces ciferrii]|uniref:Chaperone protein n=1 Tax=Wickerhamomyces ciferrii (strain ATCC 14091 / BCRC 22168 / CBS 111 / JCM 3599 / NBRC 0793 / NRRL Y-1031 F-60-10) TaxID=1206466 RepID=K0KA36_WICCF|nr:Chaperone protein [Wickerhamomyces ciferrii]CCH41775.1 Chaperone protein [Wickerhamomyces ciferrii]
MLRFINKKNFNLLANQKRLASTQRSTFPTVIGIDLGTTNSAVAVMEGQQAKILENDEGQRTTPSVVAFKEDGERLVGNVAKRQAILNTHNTFYATKRLIGRRFNDDETKIDFNNFPYKIVENDNGDAWVESFGNKYSPSQIGGFILQKMKETAEAHLPQKVKNAVVTVPAYFNDSQRQATKDAGQIAGLNVLRVINEPTAAALAYGLDKTNDGIVAVFDLGGGTFDISILDIEDGVFEVRSTNGDTHLGGEDFDILLVQFILNDFEKKTGIDLSNEPEKVQRIREAAERAKIDLSHVKETTIDLPFIKDKHHISIKLTEDELDTMSLHLIQRTIDPVKRALKDADLKKKDIDEVILVGGMTRMPKIRTTVEEIFGKKPSTAVNPDEAVALGAAIQGGVLSGAIKDVLLLDVTPLTLGIETYGGIFSPLVSRNTTVPVKKTEIYSTGVDNQTGVDIKVYQGERGLVQDNKLVGNFKLSGIPPLPKGEPQVEVSFDIDADGIINVSAREKTSGKQTSITVIGNSGLTEEEIKRIIDEGEQNKGVDQIKKQKVQAATNAELVINDTETAISLAFGDVLKADPEYSDLEKHINATKEAIELGKSGGDIQVADIKNRSQALQEFSIKIFQRVARKQNELRKQKDAEKK